MGEEIMRQSLATAIHSKSLQQKESHTSIDLIGAMGIAGISSPIGMAAVRFIDGLQAHVHPDLIMHLSRKSGSVIKCERTKLLKICKQVVHEATFPFCRKCLGAQEILLQTHVVKCDCCKGSGLHVYTDAERSKEVTINFDEYVKYWADRLQIVQSIFTNEQRNGLYTVKRVMER